jgi:hypothetical protein
MSTLERAEQIADTLKVTAELREQGWSAATVEVTRGGTFRVQVARDGATVARPMLGTGRERRARTLQAKAGAGERSGFDNALSPLAAGAGVGSGHAGEE